MDFLHLDILLPMLCLICGLGLLIALSLIDLKHRLLPNDLVLPFFITGFVFHVALGFELLPIEYMMLGALIGSGSLLFIRMVSNFFYKTDTLGLGDVKLMGAAGFWLGPYFILVALSAGAIAGVLHGLFNGFAIYSKTKTWPNMSKFSLPAGPGFAVGIVIALILLLLDAPEALF